MSAAAEPAPLPAPSDETRPVAPPPRSGLPPAAIVAACAILAIILFFTLESARRARSSASERSISMSGAITSPAPLRLPPESSPAPVREYAIATPPKPEQKPAPQLSPFNRSVPQGSPLSPNLAPYPSPQPPPSPIAATVTPRPGAASASGESALLLDTGSGSPFMQGGAKAEGDRDSLAADESAIRATRIRGGAMLVPQGTIIYAVLETPIDSTRPGLVRAMVARDTVGFDGTKVLIPRGSRLIGQAEGDAKPGQHRLLVEWNRLVRPDGVAIRIGSPASDTLGGSGISGHVNSHFFARFANAALQSALTAGVAIASRSSNSPYIYALPGPIAGAGQSLFPDLPPGSTIKVRAGAAIAVFVAHDLDFSGASSR